MTTTATGLRYYVLTSCPRCDADVHYGVCLSLLDDHRGLPVVDGHVLERERVDCPRCDAAIYFGELDYHVEGGRDTRLCCADPRPVRDAGEPTEHVVECDSCGEVLTEDALDLLATTDHTYSDRH